MQRQPATFHPASQQQQQQKPSQAGGAEGVVEPVRVASQVEAHKIRLGDLPICQLFALLQHPQAPVLPLPPAFPWLDTG